MSSTPPTTASTATTLFVAIHPFQGDAGQGQLSFSKGDTIHSSHREEQHGWLWGTRDGASGWFPLSYVCQVVTTPSLPKPGDKALQPVPQPSFAASGFVGAPMGGTSNPAPTSNTNTAEVTKGVIKVEQVPRPKSSLPSESRRRRRLRPKKLGAKIQNMGTSIQQNLSLRKNKSRTAPLQVEKNSTGFVISVNYTPEESELAGPPTERKGFR